ncbi:hypothetical protein BH18GEM1_BH18GEM1_03070 [soil metagenome]
MRSPYHLRVVEVRNLTAEGRTLTIEPSVGQHLGAATTFTGMLRPGEIKVLYLYHGFEYEFRVMPPGGGGKPVRGVFDVERDLGLTYSGVSLIPDGRVVADLGDPATTFADSLQDLDPFGLRSRRTIEPDTSRGHDFTPMEERQRARRGGSGRNP